MSKEIENKFINSVRRQHISNTKVKQAFKSPCKSNSSLTEDKDNHSKERSVRSPQVSTNTTKPIELPVKANCLTNEDGINLNNEISATVNTTPKNNTKSKFRSPFRCPVQKISEKSSDTDIRDQIDSLNSCEKYLDEQILDLENRGFKTEEAQIYMDQLHKYNEIKDIAQMVLGRLAEMDRVSLREIHKKYDAPLTD